MTADELPKDEQRATRFQNGRQERKNQTGLIHFLLRLNSEVPFAWSPFLLSVDYEKRMSERCEGKISRTEQEAGNAGRGERKGQRDSRGAEQGAPCTH